MISDVPQEYTSDERVMPQAEDMPEILSSVDNSQVNDAIRRLSDDPSQIMNIINDIQDRPDILGSVMRHIESNPSYKNQLNSMMQTNSKMRNSVNGMSNKKKKELIQKMRKATAHSETSGTSLTTSRITASRQLKTITISDQFPDNTPYSNFEPHELYEGVYLYYSSVTGTPNKRVTRLCGFKVCGEVVIVRTDIDGTLSPYTNSDFKTRYGN